MLSKFTGQLLNKVIYHFFFWHNLDCKSMFSSQHKGDGFYQTLADAGMPYSRPFVCPLDFAGSEWVIIQRRTDASLDFDKLWVDYEEGFGDIHGNMWLGLKYIHALTQFDCELHVYLEKFDGDSAFAQYSQFSVGDSASKYRLSVSGYSGTAGDSLTNQNAMSFTTKDQDNDPNGGNCAIIFHGAWWHDNCFLSKLTGRYHYGHHEERGTGIHWFQFTNLYYSLKRVLMKVRRL